VNRAGQRGSALLAAIAVLSVLALLSSMALLAGGADLALSTRLSRERSALYAAESALATTLAELSAADGPLPEATFAAPWPAPEVPPRHWLDGEWSCSRTVALLPDAGDADGDPATTVRLFNRRSGYADSPVEQGGYPLVQVRVTAAAGETRRSVVAEVAPVTCAPRLDAAWTAGGPVDLAGDVVVSGSTPAFVGRGAVRLEGGAQIDGGGSVDPQLQVGTDVLATLGAGGTLEHLEELPSPPAGGPVRGIVWSRGDFSGRLDGQGILIVHNPAFDPVRHEASRRAIEEGVDVEGRDPAYSHLDPTRQPARFDPVGGGAFRGVVVADVIAGCGAPFSLAGALVTLSRSPMTVAPAARLRIAHDASAIALAGRGPLRHLTAFRPLPAEPGPAP
jgi:hypothetical protein